METKKKKILVDYIVKLGQELCIQIVSKESNKIDHLVQISLSLCKDITRLSP